MRPVCGPTSMGDRMGGFVIFWSELDRLNLLIMVARTRRTWRSPARDEALPQLWNLTLPWLLIITPDDARGAPKPSKNLSCGS